MRYLFYELKNAGAPRLVREKTNMISEILYTFISFYRWDFGGVQSDVPDWEIIEEWTHFDGNGCTGVRILYLTPPMHGFRRYVSVTTKFDEVTSIRWDNDLATFADEFQLGGIE